MDYNFHHLPGCCRNYLEDVLVQRLLRYTPATPPAILVDYHRVGGIAGFDDRLVIFDNGAAVISSGPVNREIKLNQTDIDRITSVFTAAQFSQLEGNYTAAGEVQICSTTPSVITAKP